MNKMNKNQWIAVVVGLGLIAFIFYGNVFMSMFNPSNNQTNKVATTQEGVQIQDEVVGTGDIAVAGDTISVNYSGKLDNGKVFDSSYDRGQPITFVLGVGQVIKGWDQGVVGMRVGGKRKLIISPEFGYGTSAYGPIPANSTLIFDVELMGVQHSTTTAVTQ